MTVVATSTDVLFESVRDEARRVAASEPLLRRTMNATLLRPDVVDFEDAVAATVARRLLSSSSSGGDDADPSLSELVACLRDGLRSPLLELGSTASAAAREDALACVRRDPACGHVLEVLTYFKGYAALACHRVAHREWRAGRRHSALWLQSRASAAFGVDVHPAARIGIGVMLDHGSGVVVGETAVIGDGCTLLHGVTLGGTGKEGGDRHPKLGRSVLVGAHVSVLGNITIGDGAKIGAGSVVLKPIPSGATAVGSPARIIGWSKEDEPGSAVDTQLRNVERRRNDFAANDHDASTISTKSETTTSTTDDDDDGTTSADEKDYLCPFREMDASRDPKDGAQKSMCPVLLRAVLHQEGCSEAEIGEVYFSLLRKSSSPDSGISKDVCENHFVKVACDRTCMKEPKCRQIVRVLRHFFDQRNATATTATEDTTRAKL